MFAGRLDTERIAAVGHSFGGVTALSAGLLFPEIEPVVAFDPCAWLC